MPSSASSLLKVELQANGENTNTWGTKANAVFERLEQAIAGEAAITVTTADVTLSDTDYTGTESHKAYISATGALTGNRAIIVPARTKIYFVSNATTGAYALTVKTSGGTGIAVTQGKKAILYCDGTNVVKIVAQDDFATAAQGAKADTAIQADGSVAMTAGLVFEGATADDFETTLAVADPTADRTITLPDATGTIPLLESDQSWSGAQRGTVVTITYSATPAVDFAAGNNHIMTFGAGNAAFTASNMTAGQSGFITLVQDATGSRTASWSTDFEFAAGTAPTLSTAANAVDVFPYYIRASGSVVVGAGAQAVA
jgi:hypothetical protein